MRKILLAGICLAGMVQLNAQPNNPYNDRGVEFLESLAIIKKDMDAGKQLEFNDETIRYYASIIPLKAEANAEMAASILAAIKDPAVDPRRTVEQSRLSPFAKTIFLEMLPAGKISNEEYTDRLTSLVDRVVESDMPEEEKELTLTQLSFQYHTVVNGGSWWDSPCYMNVNGEVVETTRGECVMTGVFLGGMYGYTLCGWLCAVGGAIVGGIIGALT